MDDLPNSLPGTGYPISMKRTIIQYLIKKGGHPMKKTILYVGIDVDDRAFHGAGFDSEGQKTFEFKCKPTLGALLERLEKFTDNDYEVRVCYEATYIGYGLCRDIRASGIHCDIVAPSLIPEQRSKRVKTDRVDSRKLAELYAKDLLTPIAIPDKIDEQVRQLIRSRSFVVDQRKRLKAHILSLCRFNGIDYQNETNSKKYYWTKKHLVWLSSQISKQPEVTKKIFERLLYQLVQADKEITVLNEIIEEQALNERYQKKCQALIAFKGIDILSAMTLTTELGDIRRFPHPKKVVSYSGMDIIEYSSGGKEKKFGITKMGNRKIRTVLVEACQSITSGTVVGKIIRNRRKDVPAEIVDIAVRCQHRLWKKRSRMLHSGKHPNKIKMACAREMVGFIWEALVAVG
jgi:transposase